jgi:hypothetical protein
MRISDTRDLCDFVSTHDTELDDLKFAVLFYVMSGVEALNKLSSIYPMIIFLPFWVFFFLRIVSAALPKILSRPVFEKHKEYMVGTFLSFYTSMGFLL